MTGEAVALDIRTASFVSRSLAICIDLLVQFAALFALVLGLSVGSLALDETLLTALVLVAVVGVTVGYPVAMETLTRGRTLGKMALGLRVVRDDGGPVRLRHAMVRGLVGFGEFYLTSGSAALIASLLSERGKRLGDQLAGTMVVRERLPVISAPMRPVPPGLVGWARLLDLARVSDALALEIRTFLARASLLSPDVRHQRSHALAASVASCVTPPPPPGLPAEVYLAVVLAERRDRELARLAARRAAPAPRPLLAPPHPGSGAAPGAASGGFGLPG